MKVFRSKESFIPKSTTFWTSGGVVLANTDYDIVDNNLASGFCIKMFINDAFGIIKTELAYISPEENEKYAEVPNILTLEKVRMILDEFSFAHSCINFNWGFEVFKFEGTLYSENNNTSGSHKSGFLINTTFERPDINTGEMGIGSGRRMWIDETASETSVVWTAKMCIDLIISHEVNEAVHYRGARLIDQHKKVDDQVYPQTLKEFKQKMSNAQ